MNVNEQSNPEKVLTKYGWKKSPSQVKYKGQTVELDTWEHPNHPGHKIQMIPWIGARSRIVHTGPGYHDETTPTNLDIYLSKFHSKKESNMNEQAFKVGDIVKTVRRVGSIPAGEEGEVLGYDRSNVDVKFFRYYRTSIPPTDLELVQPSIPFRSTIPVGKGAKGLSFREGDKVRVTRSVGQLHAGDTGEVVGHYASNPDMVNVRIKGVTFSVHADDLEKIQGATASPSALATIFRRESNMNAFDLVKSRLNELLEEFQPPEYYPYEAEVDPATLSSTEILDRAIEETRKVYDLMIKQYTYYTQSLAPRVGALLTALEDTSRVGGTLASRFPQEEFEDIVDSIERMPYVKAYIREAFMVPVANMIKLVRALY